MASNAARSAVDRLLRSGELEEPVGVAALCDHAEERPVLPCRRRRGAHRAGVVGPGRLDEQRRNAADVAVAGLQRRQRVAAVGLGELHCPALRVVERRAALIRSEIEDHQLAVAGGAGNPVLRAAHRVGRRLRDPARRDVPDQAGRAEAALRIDRRQRDARAAHASGHPARHSSGRRMSGRAAPPRGVPGAAPAARSHRPPAGAAGSAGGAGTVWVAVGSCGALCTLSCGSLLQAAVVARADKAIAAVHAASPKVRFLSSMFGFPLLLGR